MPIKKNSKIGLIILGILIGGLVTFSIIFLMRYQNLERVQYTVSGVLIDDFAYWLNDIDKEAVKNSKYDLIIMDYSSDGGESGDMEKKLISYISIGEAENYRYYWNSNWDANGDGIPDAGAPEWLDNLNPDWAGNYKVQYWNSSWQDIIYNYLDRIIAANFNGIYMDIIDAYEYYQATISHSDWLMIDFVGNISNYVKTNAGSTFAVFVQNADALLSNTTYLSYIDGIGREDLFYDDDQITESSTQKEGILNLNLALNANKVVLIIDYPIIMDNIYECYRSCINAGFLAYVAERELNSLKEYSFYSPT